MAGGALIHIWGSGPPLLTLEAVASTECEISCFMHKHKYRWIVVSLLPSSVALCCIEVLLSLSYLGPM